MGARRPTRECTVERLREVLDYDPATGVFRWRVSNGRRAVAGEIAGCVAGEYWMIGVDGLQYRASRLAWAIVTGRWPTRFVDHRSTDGLDNRWTNLREADQPQNSANRRLNANNTSGFKGVHFDRSAGCWRATIRVRGRRHSLGRFAAVEDAAAAYAEAAQRHFGEFARP